eukprot:TRINITY_DN9654_c0_g1_i1.p1 TRINITY_DN9654_c0_g1~~TRINITY_DN9654_c0_g1_i1.p1  ORF type:complete len:122 (-),score=31.10 TRINITY_DN9654_c0_g1_i1:176-541(-)
MCTNEIFGIESFMKGDLLQSNKEIVAITPVAVCKINIFMMNIIFEKFPFMAGQFTCYCTAMLSQCLTDELNDDPEALSPHLYTQSSFSSLETSDENSVKRFGNLQKLSESRLLPNAAKLKK